MGTTEMVVAKEVDKTLGQAAAKAKADAGDTGDAGAIADEAGLDAGDIAQVVDAEAGEAGAPPNLIIPTHALKRAVNILEREGVTEEGVIAIVRAASKHEAHHAHRRGHMEGFVHGVKHARRGMPGRGRGHVRGHAMVEHDFEVPWRRSQTMRDYRYDVIERYSATHGGMVDSARGFYYGTLQVTFIVDGSLEQGGVFILSPAPQAPTPPNTLNPVVDSCFNLAISQVEPNWFGGAHTLDLSDTNLQNPGQNIYPDECFIVEAVSTDLKAVRISYPNQVGAGAGINTQGLNANTVATINGANPVWDRAGLFLPAQLFNQFDDTCEVAQAVAEVGVISFGWQNLGFGANNTVSTKPVERMKAVPGVARRGMQETSGGALSLDLPRGYLWMLDQQFQANEDEGGNGLFSAQLGLFTNVSFPFTPISVLGTSAPIMPSGLALEWQITLWGTSLLPAKANRYAVAPRRRT